MITLPEEMLIPSSWIGLARRLIPEWSITISAADLTAIRGPGTTGLTVPTGKFSAGILIDVYRCLSPDAAFRTLLHEFGHCKWTFNRKFKELRALFPDLDIGGNKHRYVHYVRNLATEVLEGLVVEGVDRDVAIERAGDATFGTQKMLEWMTLRELVADWQRDKWIDEGVLDGH